MNDDLPPPVTRNSSKADLWKELECVRAETDQQQRQINELRKGVPLMEAELCTLRWQLGLVRYVIEAKFS